MAISTENITTGGKGSLPKTLQPGNRVVQINRVYLDTVPWSESAYNLMLDCEGPNLGESFEGFFIDKDQQSLGRYKGQVGRVRASRWLFEDKDLGEIQIKRDLEIVKFLNNLCEAVGAQKWMKEANNKFDTIEEFVDQFNKDKPFAGKFISACIGGKEYENKEGYVNHDLFFPKFSKAGVPFESEEVEPSVSRVYKFNETDHIIPLKNKPVESFSSGILDAPDSFELD